jgi:hypothetical protein
MATNDRNTEFYSHPWLVLIPSQVDTLPATPTYITEYSSSSIVVRYRLKPTSASWQGSGHVLKPCPVNMNPSKVLVCWAGWLGSNGVGSKSFRLNSA